MTVVGATKGAARRLARTATNDTLPWSGTTSGAQTAWAAIGMARTGPNGLSGPGNRREMARPHGWARTSRPRVATLDSAKP